MSWDLLKLYRRQAGFTQRALAEEVGVTQNYISLLEAGRRKSPSRDLVERLSSALGLNESQAREFYTSAGYTQNRNPPQEELLKKIEQQNQEIIGLLRIIRNCQIELPKD